MNPFRLGSLPSNAGTWGRLFLRAAPEPRPPWPPRRYWNRPPRPLPAPVGGVAAGVPDAAVPLSLIVDSPKQLEVNVEAMCPSPDPHPPMRRSATGRMDRIHAVQTQRELFYFQLCPSPLSSSFVFAPFLPSVFSPDPSTSIPSVRSFFNPVWSSSGSNTLLWPVQ